MIPSPRKVEYGDGRFVLDGSARIVRDPAKGEAVRLAEVLRERLRGIGCLEIGRGEGAAGRGIRLDVREENDAVGNSACGVVGDETVAAADEAYRLSVEPAEVVLTGGRLGVARAIETLCQMLPPAVAAGNATEQVLLSCVTIEDRPAFAWRGLMLDCSRHFLSKAFILRTIDVMARLKMNRLHLHLVDDHGWRLEVPGYPELTRVGSRIEQGPARHGFYTRDDLREIVERADRHGIVVVPEIEVPGHAYSAVKSYPNLCCTRRPGRNQGHQKDLYCAGRDETFAFLEAVVREVTEAFPGPYVHVGGDEAPKDRWRECGDCRRRMRDLGLVSEEQLQAWMIGRVAAMLRNRGRRAIGWEEVLDGEPAGDVLVQWWRHRTHGDAAAVEAVRRGHRVIASPNSFCYLSFPVVPNEHFKPERTSDLRKAYACRYVPEGLSAEQRQRVIGAECCVWTEYLTEEQIDRMLFPRVLAHAELMWNDPAERDFEALAARVRDVRPWWEALGVAFGPWGGQGENA